jgi:O6-methylguanine-DNA--protein-cysteine methyltransferase
MLDLFIKIFPAAVSAVCLVIVANLSVRLTKLSREFKKRERSVPDSESTELSDLKHDLEALAARLTTLELEPRDSSVGVSLRSGMNLNKRTQALRQLRLGQATGDIAKNLEMPKAEVDLLVKVHRIVSQQN